MSDPTTDVAPPVHRLTAMVTEKFGNAFVKASAAVGNERVIWEVFPIAAPNPMNMGQIMTGLAVYCSIPSTVIGQHLTITAVVEGHMVEADQEIIDEFARDRINELLAARFEKTQEETAQAAGNGHPEAPPSGLVMPGR